MCSAGGQIIAVSIWSQYSRATKTSFESILNRRLNIFWDNPRISLDFKVLKIPSNFVAIFLTFYNRNQKNNCSLWNFEISIHWDSEVCISLFHLDIAKEQNTFLLQYEKSKSKLSLEKTFWKARCLLPRDPTKFWPRFDNKRGSSCMVPQRWIVNWRLAKYFTERSILYLRYASHKSLDIEIDDNIM